MSRYSFGTGFRVNSGSNINRHKIVSPRTAYPAASWTNPEMESDPYSYAQSERKSARIILFIKAKTIDIPTSATFFQNLSRNIAARKDPEKRHAVRLRIPLHASATPTAPSGKCIEFPRSSTRYPKKSITAVTITATFESR